MKALVKQKAEPGLWLLEQPTPQIGPDDVLVKVHKTGICGTDIHIYNWDEWAQTHDPGADDRRPRIFRRNRRARRQCAHSRDRAAGLRRRPCHRHEQPRRARRALSHGPARRAASASTFPAPSPNTCAFPPSTSCRCPTTSTTSSAPFSIRSGNAVHTALAFDLVGEDVLIAGAGPIGIMAGAVARHVGARHVVITDVNPHAPRAGGRSRRRRARRRDARRTSATSWRGSA